MTFSTCKYDRELQYMWSKVRYLNTQLETLGEPDNEEEAKVIDKRRKEIEDEIRFLTERYSEIETSYVENGMEEYLYELKRKTSAPATPPEFSCSAKKEVPPAEKERETVESITSEISELELRLIKAHLSGDSSEQAKLTMAISALRTRRSDMVEEMKAGNAKGPEPDADLRRDVESLRIQTSELRNDIIEIKDFLNRIADRLNIRDQ